MYNLANSDSSPIACQHMILRKHALLRLTALMERYSPPYKTGWAWSVPKFIKKMTTPNYKGKLKIDNVNIRDTLTRFIYNIRDTESFSFSYPRLNGHSGLHKQPGESTLNDGNWNMNHMISSDASRSRRVICCTHFVIILAKPCGRYGTWLAKPFTNNNCCFRDFT